MHSNGRPELRRAQSSIVEVGVDFPICIVPSIEHDLAEPMKPWSPLCPISDSTARAVVADARIAEHVA